MKLHHLPLRQPRPRCRTAGSFASEIMRPRSAFHRPAAPRKLTHGPTGTLASYLAKTAHLSPKSPSLTTAPVPTDVDGLYTSNPWKDPNARPSSSRGISNTLHSCSRPQQQLQRPQHQPTILASSAGFIALKSHLCHRPLARAIQGLCRTLVICLSILVIIGRSFLPFLLVAFLHAWFYI
ncbi:hypothetical protein DFP72DRAFT_1177863 [Ephemerocybe angulata]|uniref:Uncharacterized protein n=1 Tax=Ephemerocybe angulata TaxID=980116 RepID=A0A8H6LWQ6_9AGAR|nr:hypothetical protein DFP72DRAFT_1177863 [Tulosesus angulatus]